MKELVIEGLRIVCDARDDDANKQAHTVLYQFNQYGTKLDGSPTVFIQNYPLESLLP